MTPKCHRCGAEFEPRRAGDTRCIQCEQQVAALIAPKPRSWTPVWMRQPFPKVLA